MHQDLPSKGEMVGCLFWRISEWLSISPVLWLTNGAKNKGELTMFSMFKVISIRSHEIRTVYAVDNCARFLIYRDGEWSWNDSSYYRPVEVV